MKNQRVSEKRNVDFSVFGLEIVRWDQSQDFCIRNITAKPGLFAVFDKAPNSNYYAFRVLKGDPKEVRKLFETFSWEKNDFLSCTALLFVNQDELFTVLERNYGRL